MLGPDTVAVIDWFRFAGVEYPAGVASDNVVGPVPPAGWNPKSLPSALVHCCPADIVWGLPVIVPMPVLLELTIRLIGVTPGRSVRKPLLLFAASSFTKQTSTAVSGESVVVAKLAVATKNPDGVSGWMPLVPA